MNDPRKAVAARRPRPLPRPQRWTLDVAASGNVTSWREPAGRLVAALGELAAVIEIDYGKPVVWRNSQHGERPWRDAGAVEGVMRRSEASSRDATSPAPGSAHGSAHGVVHGYLDGSLVPIVDVLWTAALDGRVLNVTARFNPRGGARSLARHDPEWLVGLLGAAVDASWGNAGRIVTSSWLKEDERRMHHGGPSEQLVPYWLGEVTFIPRRIDPATLPGTLQAHACSTSAGTGTVVILSDLTATVLDPARAVTDMLALRRYLPG